MDLRRLFTSSIINLLIEKDLLRGSIPQINILELRELFLKTELMAIKPSTISWVGSLSILFVPQRTATFFNEGGSRISLVRERIFSPRSPLMPRLINLLPKRFLPNVSISRKICHNWVFSCDVINVFMFKLKAVIVMSFKPIIIIKSHWRNWIHNISVRKCNNLNQYQSKIMKLELYCNLNKPCNWN